MSFDSRLVVEKFPSFQGVELCEFLKTMNEQEKATQTKELELFNAAMAEFRSHDNKFVVGLFTCIFSVTSLVATVLVGAVMTAKSDRRFMAKPLFVLTALALTFLVIGSLFGMIKYGNEASKVKFPPLNYNRLLRVQTRIREIKERLKTEGLPEDEKKQLNTAHDTLKVHYNLMLLRPHFCF